MKSRRFSLPDLFILVPTFLLLSLGILVIYSSDPRLAVYQVIYSLVGFGLYFFLNSLDFEYYNDFVKYLYWIIIGLLVIVFLIGVETRGSLRWIPLGPVTIQPSEFAKPVMILFLARFWSRNLPNWKNILKSVLFLAPVALLIFKQPDLGTTLTILIIWLMTLIGANVSFKKLVVMGLIVLSVMPVGWLILKSYQKDRIESFLFPSRDPLGRGYNVIQSSIAVGSGQIFGRGLGHGTQSRLQFLPEFRTDFIFASIAEEFGFIGSMIVLVLFGVIVFRLTYALNNANRFGSLVLFGVVGMLIFQVVVNIGMNIGIMPVTGITLPFLSYGGSSLVATMVSLALANSVIRRGRSEIVYD